MIAAIRPASIRRIPIILPNSSKIRDGASRYFVRDDDAGELTGELRLFVEMFANCGIPVSYQVIPARLTPACAAFFLDMSSGYPGMIEFGQHRLHHQMWLGDREVARAFGPEQTLEDQTQTILDGLARMRALLGEHARIDTFTAPRHKFDGNTVRTAAAAGFKVFSAACYETPQHQLACAIGPALSASAIHHHGFSYNGRMRPEAPIIERSSAPAWNSHHMAPLAQSRHQGAGARMADDGKARRSCSWICSQVRLLYDSTPRGTAPPLAALDDHALWMQPCAFRWAIIEIRRSKGKVAPTVTKILGSFTQSPPSSRRNGSNTTAAGHAEPMLAD